MASHRKPLEGKHWTVKRTAFIFRPHLLACVNYASLMWRLLNWYFNITVLNILRALLSVFTMFVALFIIEILPRVLNMDCKWPKLAFVQKYICFILLRGDLNICGWETDEKWTRLCCNSMDVLPSRSSSRSRDWKLSIGYSKPDGRLCRKSASRSTNLRVTKCKNQLLL